jgi:MoxR-like ATPase
LIRIEWTFSPRHVEYTIATQAKAVLAENLERVDAVISRDELVRIQKLAEQEVDIPGEIIHLINAITVATRPTDPLYPADALEAAGFGREVISVFGGASSRTTSFWPPLLRAHALFHGRDTVTPLDVLATAHPMLNHRLETNYPVDMDALIRLILTERGYAHEV